MTQASDAAKYLFWLLILQGISFIILGFLVIFYPQILFILVAATFMWVGTTTLVIAWRVHQFRNFIKELI